MRKTKYFLLLGIIALFAVACDSGDIYPKEETPTENRTTATATFNFIHTKAFPSAYNIVLATYDGSSSYPLTSVVVAAPEEDKPVKLTMDNIQKQAKTVELCLNQKHGNKRIFSFYSFPLDNVKEGSAITIPAQKIDLASFARIQQQLFTPQCIGCHGGNEKAAAGLFLTEGISYDNLVNHKSKNSPKKRVLPHSVVSSFLIDVLTKGDVVHFNHTDLSTLEEDDINLVKTWIVNGAKR